MKKWETQTTKIAVVTKAATPKDEGGRGFSILELQAWVPTGVQGLGLTPHLDYEKRYTLTHLSSGYALSYHPWKKGPLVHKLIHDLEALPIAWTESLEKIRKYPKEIQEKVVALIHEAINKDGF